MRQRLALRFSALALCWLAAFPAWTTTVEVSVQDFSFSSPIVNIQEGDTVVWNLVQGFHSVAADDGSFRSGEPATNFPFSHTFDSAGSFGYHCEVHAYMLGTVNVAAEPEPEHCVPSSTVLCLNGDRFKVEMLWRSNATAPLVPAHAVPLSFAPSSGLFYFQDPGNIEVLVKVLNACTPSLGNKYWVFYSATTNVEFQLTVTDTSASKMKIYLNPLNRPAPPVQDTAAFATCP